MTVKKSQTAARLAEELRAGGAYAEAFWCLRAGAVPLRLSAGESEVEQTVELLGAYRMSGGVVIQGASVQWSNDWLSKARESGDPYLREVAHKVEREQERAARAGCAPV